MEVTCMASIFLKMYMIQAESSEASAVPPPPGLWLRRRQGRMRRRYSEAGHHAEDPPAHRVPQVFWRGHYNLEKPRTVLIFTGVAPLLHKRCAEYFNSLFSWELSPSVFQFKCETSGTIFKNNNAETSLRIAIFQLSLTISGLDPLHNNPFHIISSS